ncbi:ATP-dependent RNA helicase DHX33 [Lepeophtheirus salmonis]|uniref:ATP-dependent RNA helicase DHX33 n=1 Tax=Lepeophtheirus salmonis TaxID=72036 RepID=UPI001AE8A3B9|nr:ATP-dependent RNA helicase DHX33-like [Lepeophtheirus salmonis]
MDPSPGFNAKRSFSHLKKETKPWINGKKKMKLIKEIDPMLKQRRALPIFGAKPRFLEEVRRSNTVILLGETGSGKTTQIPQFLHEARLDSEGLIGITQPRRVAAISVSKRVAQEMNVSLGTLVGYKVRFEQVAEPNSITKILFQTDGMLLREAMLDPNLKKYSWIILDEAHERTINTDVLLGIVKRAQAQRKSAGEKPLKIIIMSATMNAQKFSHYFGGSPILYVHGRQYPVNVSHASISQSDWLTSTLSTVFQLHEQAPPQHDFLVFLTGQEEIENLAHTIRALSKDLQGSVKIFVLPLYSAQASIMQQKVFIDSPPGSRKIILSTNIAETSLTIPGIRYVIDSCRVKAKVHMASTGLDMLKVVRISKAQASQRMGRAGRQSEGHCYRLLTKREFDLLDEETVPEILRCNISNVLLQLVASGVRDIRKFEFLQRPPPNAIEGAIRQLSLLGAFKSDESQELTDIGIRLSKFPLDPKFAKAIISANELGCSEEVLTIVALLSSENIILTPPSNREECLKSREKFSSSEGDHISLLNIFRAFKASDNKKDFCKNHHLNLRNLNFSIQIRSQLMDLCRNEDINVQSCANQGHLVREALADGLFMNVAKLTVEGHYLTLDSRQQVKIHPSSVLFRSKPELVIFTELIATQKSYIRDLSLVDAQWLLKKQPDYFRKHHIKF